MLKRFRLLGWGTTEAPSQAEDHVSRDDSPSFERAFAERQEEEKLPEGFGEKSEVWIYLRPGTNEALLVSGPEGSDGHRLTPHQKRLLAKGMCLEVLSLTPVSEYWRQPYETALKKMPRHVGTTPSEDPPMKKAARLAQAGAAVGIWLRISMPKEELPPND